LIDNREEFNAAAPRKPRDLLEVVLGDQCGSFAPQNGI
jgi:hypothetical protein